MTITTNLPPPGGSCVCCGRWLLPGHGTTPDNARGIPAASAFWRMCETDQERFRRGWWAAYDDRPCPEREREAFRLGHEEALVMLGKRQVLP